VSGSPSDEAAPSAEAAHHNATYHTNTYSSRSESNHVHAVHAAESGDGRLVNSASAVSTQSHRLAGSARRSTAATRTTDTLPSSRVMATRTGVAPAVGRLDSRADGSDDHCPDGGISSTALKEFTGSRTGDERQSVPAVLRDRIASNQAATPVRLQQSDDVREAAWHNEEIRLVERAARQAIGQARRDAHSSSTPEEPASDWSARQAEETASDLSAEQVNRQGASDTRRIRSSLSTVHASPQRAHIVQSRTAAHCPEHTSGGDSATPQARRRSDSAMHSAFNEVSTTHMCDEEGSRSSSESESGFNAGVRRSAAALTGGFSPVTEGWSDDSDGCHRQRLAPNVCCAQLRPKHESRRRTS
jgi:hypothetical protein